jgi:hypothetical protein
MSREYKTISSEAELTLMLSACKCNGFDIVRTFKKSPPTAIELACCNCGARRARRCPSGIWSAVIDKDRQTRARTIYNPFEEFFEFLNGKLSMSVSGNPDGSPINEMIAGQTKLDLQSYPKS